MTVESLPVARARFLRSVLPGMKAYPLLEARYAVELARLEGRTPEQVHEEFHVCAAEGHQHGSTGTTCLYCEAEIG